MKGKKCSNCGEYKVFTSCIIFQAEYNTELDTCRGCGESCPPRIETLTKIKTVGRKKKTNNRLENFNKVLSRLTVKAPAQKKEKTGIARSIEDFGRPLREMQNSKKDYEDINLGEDHEQSIEL